MKRLLFFICTLLCANVLFAQTTFWIGNIRYEITSTNPAEVKVYEANSSITTANIPEIVTYQGTDYSVTSIGDYAFFYCSSLTSVTIPNSVTSIGIQAFYECSNLTSVTIPNSVTSIGSGAFEYCSSLISVTIPNSVTSIGNSAFRFCSSLISVTIGNSVTSIGDNAFAWCDDLTSVTIPNSVTSIGNYAFRGCSSLTSVNIPNSVTSIGNSAFSYCSSLTSVIIGNSVTSIESAAFSDCSSLTSVIIGNSVTSIGQYAFYGCSSLTSVTCLRSNSPSLGSSVFYETPNNKTLTIPCGCESEYTNWQNATTWASIDCLFTIGDLTYKITSETEVKVQACTESATSVVIPETVTYQGTIYSVTSIGQYAFYGCSSLTSVTIPNSVTSIGDFAFKGCSSLITLNFNAMNCSNFNSGSNHPFYNNPIATINIGDSVQRIPNYFAYDLDFLTSITIPNSVTDVGNYAFNGCRDLTSVTCLGENPSTLGSNAFLDTPLNKVLYFPFCSIENYATSDWSDYFDINIKEGGLTYVYNNNNTLKVINCDDTLTSVVIPFNISNETCSYNVTEIGNNAFYNSSNLTFITIGNNITSIEDSAFYGCRDLTSVTCLGENPSTLGSNAFLDTPLNKVLYFPFCSIENYATSDWSDYFDINIKEGGLTYVYNNNNTLKVINCDDTLTSVVIPSNISNETCSYNVTEIGNSAFYNCSNLTSITIGNNITSIKDSAFYGCSSLTTLNFNAINCNDFNSNNHPFVDSPISTITIGENVQRIPNYFAYNNSLITSINVPNSASEIGTNAFNGCSNVLSISLGNSVTSIGDSAFYGCSNITSIDIPNSVTEIGADAFNGCDMMMLVNLGENLSFIGSNAFNGCAFLQSVNCLATIPPTLQGSSVFPNPNIATLTVPCGSLEAYSSPTSFWNILFNGRIEEDCEDDSGIEQAEETLLSFFPNPTKSEITFSQAIEKIEVIDLTGKAILTFSNAKTINIESLPAGAYYLRLTNNDKAIMQKVIKQ